MPGNAFTLASQQTLLHSIHSVRLFAERCSKHNCIDLKHVFRGWGRVSVVAADMEEARRVHPVLHGPAAPQ